jgi:hypothetical protein
MLRYYFPLKLLNHKRKLKSPDSTGGNLNNDFETDRFQVWHKTHLRLESEAVEVEIILHKHGVIPGVGQKHKCKYNGV